MSNEEEMMKLTKEMLGIEGEDDCLTPAKAIFNEEIGENNILVLGLNPAGNKEDVKRENECDIYLKYVKGDNIELKSKLVYKKYFKPIYDLLSEVYDGNIKFSWCNIEEKALEERLNKYKEYVEKQKEERKAEYKNENTKNLFKICQEARKEKKEKAYTILIGELFYYHQTSSKDFIKKINDRDKEFNNKIKNMLDLHIEKVLAKGKTLEFILINNARASEYIRKALPEQKDSDTCYRYNKIPIFFSGMLSNGGESKYGKQRLIKEIKKEKGIA